MTADASPTDPHTWLDARVTTLLRRSASPPRVLLAALCRVLHAPDVPSTVTVPVLRRWLISRARNAPDVVRLASNRATWNQLTTVASAHPWRDPSSSLHARRPAELLLASILRPVDSAAGRRSALALPAVAAVGVDLLADERGWDTALIGAPALAVDLGATPGRARTALLRAEDERRLRTVSRRQGTSARYRLPGRLSGVDELVLHSLGEAVDALAGEWSVGDLHRPLDDPDSCGWPDDPLAALLISVRHPAWGYGTWNDPKLGRPVDAWRLWAVAVAEAAGYDDPGVLGVGARPLPALRRTAERFGLGRIGGGRLRAQLDFVATSPEPTAWVLADTARTDLRRRQAERAQQVQRHRVTKHIGALVEHLGAWPEGREDQIAWAEAATEWSSRRTVRPAEDRLLLIEGMATWLARSGADGALAGRLAERIWAAPDSPSEEVVEQARKITDDVAWSMALEGQAITDEAKEAIFEDLVSGAQAERR